MRNDRLCTQYSLHEQRKFKLNNCETVVEHVFAPSCLFVIESGTFLYMKILYVFRLVLLNGMKGFVLCNSLGTNL